MKEPNISTTAENTAVLHHQAHVRCTTVTLSNPVPTIGPRNVNQKILPSVHSAHLYFRMDFRTNTDYSLIRHKLIFITPRLLRGTKHNFIHNSGYTKSVTLILLTWRICRAPNNASKREMGFNLASKGLNARSDYERSVVGKVAMGQVFLRELPPFPCQYHSTKCSKLIFIYMLLLPE